MLPSPLEANVVHREDFEQKNRLVCTPFDRTGSWLR